MITFKVNDRKVSAQENTKLIRFLRDDLKLYSVKNGCSEGACGTCMVIVDGKATKACILNTSKLEGKEIITVEGLTDFEKEVYSQSFARAGAVQCGFCTPGMVISAKALIDTNPNPDINDVRNAIKNNICRCTGYKKIETAILTAAQWIREHKKPETLYFTGSVGENIPRIDAITKTLGTAEYADDIVLDNMLVGGAVRTPSARAKIISIDVSKARQLDGVVAVITAKELPGAHKIGHIKHDWDILIKEGSESHTVGDALVLIAAKTPEILEVAKSLVVIEHETLQPINSPQEAMQSDAPHLHEGGNLLVREHLQRGNADEKIANAAHVVTNNYSVPFTEHAFLEPETAIAIPHFNDETKRGTELADSIIVRSADQGIYETRKECAMATGLPIEKVRVIATIIGGGFGGKEDMSVQHHAAILARITGYPVKMSLTRQESINIHPKRHAMEIKMTTACDKNGKLTAMKAVLIADTGAYASLGGPVLQRACTHAAGPYNYQDIDIIGEAWYTNNPPAGAFRGFGVTQSCFAIEQNINMLAEKVGISPWEIRYKNAIREGQVLPNGQIADENTALVETLDAVKSYYDTHPKSGIACAMKNSGIGVGLPDAGRCRLHIQNGKIHIHSAASCIGQGMGTVTIQMLCKTLNIDHTFAEYHIPDTELAPDSGNTTASRQTLFTGQAVCLAAKKLKDILGDISTKNKLIDALKNHDEEEVFGEYLGETDKLSSEKENPISHIAYSYATHLVDIDEEGRLRKVIAAHDSGTVINPPSIQGQVEGGVTMCLGYALTEDFPLENGLPKVKFGTLGLLKSTQVPKIETIFCCAPSIKEKALKKAEDSESQGLLAWGAKGIGEISSIPGVPAAALAWYNFDGQFRTKLPFENTIYSRKRKG